MSIIDEKFQDNKLHYVLQCLLATITLAAVLLIMNIFTESAIITSLGASSFIVFAMPQHYSSKTRRIIGGYAVGLLIGFLFYIYSQTPFLHPSMNQELIIILSAAFSVGVSIFLMVLFNIEHAPACGVALGLIINEWTYITIFFIIMAIIWLSLVKTLAKKWLIDLA